MDKGTDKSFIMAARLKQLRESRGLSHESLSNALFKQYGVKVSTDSLINYEVSNPHHARAYKNQGMRVEYLRCFADFYQVSADYLIGISDVKSQDSSISTIVKSTGLSESAALSLKIAKDAADSKNDCKNTFTSHFRSFNGNLDNASPKSIKLAGESIIYFVEAIIAAAERKEIIHNICILYRELHRQLIEGKPEGDVDRAKGSITIPARLFMDLSITDLCQKLSHALKIYYNPDNVTEEK